MESQPVDSNDPIVRDGFRVVRKTFVVPENIHPLDSHTKRQATICNLLSTTNCLLQTSFECLMRTTVTPFKC
jgi:hypothetical protein